MVSRVRWLDSVGLYFSFKLIVAKYFFESSERIFRNDVPIHGHSA